MKQSTATERTHITGKQTADGVRTTSPKSCHSLYVGMDVHKDTIAVAIAAPGRLDPEYRGEIPNNSREVDKLIKKLNKETGVGDTNPATGGLVGAR